MEGTEKGRGLRRQTDGHTERGEATPPDGPDRHPSVCPSSSRTHTQGNSAQMCVLIALMTGHAVCVSSCTASEWQRGRPPPPRPPAVRRTARAASQPASHCRCRRHGILRRADQLHNHAARRRPAHSGARSRARSPPSRRRNAAATGRARFSGVSAVGLTMGQRHRTHTLWWSR